MAPESTQHDPTATPVVEIAHGVCGTVVGFLLTQCIFWVAFDEFAGTAIRQRNGASLLLLLVLFMAVWTGLSRLTRYGLRELLARRETNRATD